jgi:tetratricopeptide (TPR) repeat protein
MLTGRGSFVGETVSNCIADILAHEPDRGLLPEGLPANVRRLLRRCQEKDPESRLQEHPDPERMREALNHYQELVALKEAQGGKTSDADYAAALVNLCDGLIQLRDLKGALEACRKAARLYPDQADVFYNLGGACALAGEAGPALDALERDFALGDRDYQYLASDEWFSSLREDPRFQSLIRRMKGHPSPGS